jgi:hypothetical protein
MVSKHLTTGRLVNYTAPLPIIKAVLQYLPTIPQGNSYGKQHPSS